MNQGARKMSAEKIQNLMNSIGGHLSSDSHYNMYPILMYAEVGDNYAGASMFRDLGSHALYRRYPDTPIERLLMELWDLFPPAKKWVELEYVLRDGRFSVEFIYQADFPEDEDPFDRIDRAIFRYFGEKPVVYPPMERGDDLYEL
jgi:hypothetical protein